MATDWNALANEYKGDFKPFAPTGEYTAKVKTIKVDKTPKGSYYVQVEFEQGDEYQYPRSAQHWLSRSNINWCKWHHMNLMQVLGANETAAKTAIDKIEISGIPEEKVMAGYEKAYKSLEEKHATVKVVVRNQYDQDGNMRTYTSKKTNEELECFETEFKDSRVFIDNTPKKGKKVESVSKVITGAEEANDIDLDDIPF